MRLFPASALLGVLFAFPLQAHAQDAAAAAQPSSSWRNYRRAAAPFGADSTTCEVRAEGMARGMSAAAHTAAYESCLSERGWLPMRIVAGVRCPPVTLQAAGADSASVAPFLAEMTATLTRRFRPATPDDSAAHVVLTISSDDVRARPAGIAQAQIPLAARLAVAGARAELPQFTTKPPSGPISLAAAFSPRCVSEFPAADAVVPTQGAYFEFQVTKPVMPRSGERPVYPPALRDAHTEGNVLVQFVVDTMGVPEMNTFKVLRSSHEMFTEAVREVLPSMRFVPATLQGRRVRQVVQQPFIFALPR